MIIILKDGTKEFINGCRDFKELLYEKLGMHAEECFEELIENVRAEVEHNLDDDPLMYCAGECDKVYETQQYWETRLEDLLEEIELELRKIYQEHLSLKRPHKLYMIADLINKIEKMRG